MADYSGNGIDDLAIKCPTGWHVAIYGSGFSLDYERIIEYEGESSLSLPPVVYPGGMRFEEIRGILEHYDLWDEYQDKDPFAPHTVNCIKHWAPPPTYCLAQ